MAATKATASKTSKIGLTAKQQIAIAEMIKCATDTQAAKAAGVARSTLLEWKRYNPEFIKEYRRQSNLITAAALAAYTDQVQESTSAALAAVTAACKSGDVSTSKWLLEKAASLSSSVTTAFNHISTPPEYVSEDLEDIFKSVAELEATDLLGEELQSLDSFINDIDPKRKQVVSAAIKSLKAEYAHLVEQERKGE